MYLIQFPIISQTHRIIRTLSTGLKTPVSVKIRIFPEIEKTVAYARMFERAGASVVAVHGRTRDQKSPSASRASWDHIKAVKEVRARGILLQASFFFVL